MCSNNLSSNISFKEFIKINILNLDQIKDKLEQDASLIHEIDGVVLRTPIFTVLLEKNSIDALRLLIEHGADLEHSDLMGYTPLLFALQYPINEAYIIELLTKGSNVQLLNAFGDSPLCLAFENCLSKNLVEHMLRAGCSIHTCGNHESVWHCFVKSKDAPNFSGFSADIVKLLIEAGADVNAVDNEDRSPLCLALFHGAGVKEIKVLLSKGALNSCRKHASPLLCATDGNLEHRPQLKAEVVELLLSKGALLDVVNTEGFTPLQCALAYSQYKTDAIRLLFKHSGMDVANMRHETIGNLLHFVIKNGKCKPPSVIQFLLEKGVRLDEVNSHRQTPLHTAINGQNDNLHIIKLLAEKGSPVNEECSAYKTPLKLAVQYNMPHYVFSALFAAGAQIQEQEPNNSQMAFGCLMAVRQRGSVMDEEVLKILVKQYVMEKLNANVYSELRQLNFSPRVVVFAKACARELRRMKHVNIGHGLSLFEFIKGYFPQNVPGIGGPNLNFDFNLLLQAISKHDFPIYFSPIANRLWKLLMERLSVLQPEMLCNDCLQIILDYLPKVDILTLVQTFCQI